MSINAQPFSPTFKLVGNLSDSQILVYDASENAFVNATNTGASGSTGLTSVLNTGTGEGLGQATGSALELKSLIAGTNLTITDNGTALVLDATSTATNITGTNLGTGSGVYKQNNIAGDQLEFKSIAVGNGLSITDANDTLSIECTITTAGFLQTTNNLSDIGDAATARTNLSVYSKAEADAKYFRVDQSMTPTVDNTFDLGSPTKRFNDIYAESFQGVATLADSLTISGNSGDVLTYNGSSWVASAPAGGGGGGGGGVAQTLSYNNTNNTLSISGGNSVTITPYVDLDPYVRLDQSSIPTVDNTFDIGSPTKRYNDVYAETFQGTAVLADNLTITGSTSGDVLTWNGSTWIASAPAGGGGTPASQTLSYSGNTLSISGGNSVTISPYIDLDPYVRLDQSSIPTQDNQFDIGSPTKRYQDVYAESFQGVATLADNLTIAGNTGQILTYNGSTWVAADNAGAGGGGGSGTPQTLTLTGSQIAISGGNNIDIGPLLNNDYNNLANKPTIPADVSDLTDTNNLLGGGSQSLTLTGTQLAISGGNTVDFAGMFTDTDNQTLSFDTSTNILTIANGNNVDLSNLAGGSYTDSDAIAAVTGANLNMGSNDVTTTGKILYANVYNTEADLPSATTYHGMFAHVHGTGKGYFSHGGNWVPLANEANVPVDVSDLTDTTNLLSSGSQTLSLSGTQLTISGQNTVDFAGMFTDTDNQTLSFNTSTNILTIANGNTVDLSTLAGSSNVQTIDDLSDVSVTGTSDGQFLVYNNTSGEWENQSVSIPTNVSELTNDSGYLTSVGTINYNDLSNKPTIPANLGDLSNVSSNAPSTGHVLKWSGSEWAPAADSTATGGSGISLADLSSGVGLSYNNVTGQFALNAAIGDLLDVNTSGIASGQILKWNGSTFVPGDDNVLQSTDNLPEGTSNLYYTDARADARATLRINSATTDNISEGSTNLYYTDARVDTRVGGLLQAGPGINIIPAPIPGQPITIENTNAGTTYTDADARNAISVSTGAASGNGSLAYNSSTGAFTFAPADLSSYSTFSGSYNDLTNKPSVITLSALSATTIAANGGGALTYDSGTGTFTFTPPDLSSYSTFDGNYNSLTNKPTLFDGAYSSLTGAPTIPSALGDLTMPSGTSGQVLTTDGSGNFTFTTVSGGGSSYGDSDVETLFGQYDFHLLPDANATYDIGSASKKVRHLFLSDNSLYIGNNTLNTSGSNLMFNSQDVMDYTNIKNKPTIPTDVDDLTDTGNLLGGTSYTAGTGLQLNTNSFSLNANIGDLQNVSATAPSSGQVLSWTGSEWAPAAAGGTPNLSSNSVGELNDVNISGISAGQFLEWDGTRFVAASASAADLSSESITELQDVSTDSPNNGDVLTWDTTSSSYKPSAPASGGGGSGGTSVERFKLNYSTAGQLSSISNTTSGVSASILSATGGDVEVTFSGHSYPPAGVLIYGYVRTTNEYAIMPLNKDIGTRKVAAGGTPGYPTAFGSLGSSTLTLTLREADTGASRSFGTDTHAWVVFTMS